MKKVIVFIIFIFIAASGFLFVVKKKTAQDLFKQGGRQVYGRGAQEFFIEHGGLQRRYLVYLPVSYDQTIPAPVILNFHGSGGNADGVDTMSLMDATADKYGFIAVYPEGTGVRVLGKTIAAWNTGIDERIAHVDDVGFVFAVIEKIKADFNVDSARIYATGMSNGAQMAYKLACERSNSIAAIAPIAAQGVFGECNIQRPIPIIHFHGTEDPCAPYNGGICGGCIQKYFKAMLGIEPQQTLFQCEPVPEYIAKWITINGIQDASPYVFYKNGGAQCIGYGKDEPGEVVLCTIKNMGHTWPGGPYGIPCENGMDARKCKDWVSIVGNLTADISANEVMWEFFSRHPLSESDGKERL